MTERKNYWDHLRDPRWQKVRLEVMARDNWKCRECGDATTTLNVHHTYYAKGRKPWEYPPESLRTLCETCHAAVSETLAEIQRRVGSLTNYQADVVLGFVRAHTVMRSDEDDSSARLQIESDYVRDGVAIALQLTSEEVDQALGGSDYALVDDLVEVMVRWSVTPHVRFNGLRISLNDEGTDLLLDGNRYALEFSAAAVQENREHFMALLHALREARRLRG